MMTYEMFLEFGVPLGALTASSSSIFHIHLSMSRPVTSPGFSPGIQGESAGSARCCDAAPL